MKSPYAWLGRAEGTAECRVIGAEPAGFLNRCAAAGVDIRAAEAEGETELFVIVPLRDLERAEQIALRSQCELKLLRRRGGSVLGKHLLRRWVPALCLIAAFLLLAWSKLYIWEINVTGNERVSSGRIRSALQDCGIGLGSFWPSFTSDNLRSELLMRLPELAWATVNIHGSRAEVIVRERVAKPELFDANEAVDLVAERIGFVTEVRALNGTAAVRPGSAVMPGDVLIAGAADSAFSGRRVLHAVGTVPAETYYELSATAPIQETVRAEEKKQSSRWALLIGKKRVNFYRNSSFCPSDCDKINSIWECKIRGLFALPLALVRERYTTYVYTEQPRDMNLLRRELEEQLHTQLLAAVGDGRIEQENYSCSEAGDCVTVCLRARCSEDIAKEQRP